MTIQERLIELLNASRDDDDRWIDGNGDYLSESDVALLNTPKAVEVTKEKLRAAWNSAVFEHGIAGSALMSPAFERFKKELGL